MAKTQKPTPDLLRQGSIEPTDKIVDRVLENHPAKHPMAFVLSVAGAMGYGSIRDYDRAASRAERFIRNNPTRRMPTHIRAKTVLKRVIELGLEKRYNVKAV
jgi:outer membrane protein assembly factor BamD (BamD/ComL family)